MLSEAANRIFTQVGPGTPMGELMRRYWHPIAAVTEMEENPVKAVRLMGEDLVLFRDQQGSYGLLDRHCPHRRADLSYGWVEECGLRCNYHGWAFDAQGRCVAQPYEEQADPNSHFKEKINIKHYQAAERAGLVWAYMGPQPAPLVPNWEPFTWRNGFRQIVYADIPCNWFQCQENSIDPVHFEWMHDNWGKKLRHEGGVAPRHLKIAFDEFDYGFTYRRIREGAGEDHPLWTIGRVCLWPNALFTGGHFEWRVPVDDENTFSVTWCFDPVPRDRHPYVQEKIPYWRGPIKDPRTGRWISTHIMNQDFIAWVGQGTIADRTQEHLGASDVGVLSLRKRFLADLDAIKRGEDPKATIRDIETNRCVRLPIAERDYHENGPTREEYEARVKALGNRRAYPFQTGQPPEVTRAFEDALGIKVEA
ncbi:MAG TPA: aromatic ring-hydroxylating dioxygenase subunit alpha [Candidatus Binataceae bacterium]|nr:aromatic ring-hydroxylating dioxygenase subunit alpha [Candidatus Binataceae bacterium]